MAKANFISFEDWVEWVFNHDDGDWVWTAAYPSWQSNHRLMVEYFVALHRNPFNLLAKFTDNQIGWGFWNLYSPLKGMSPFTPEVQQLGLFDELIDSLVPCLRSFLLRKEAKKYDVDTYPGVSFYMFWDISSIWPRQPTDIDRKLLSQALKEMEEALYVPHPVAQYHGLHGLGEFHSLAKQRTADIIQNWLATNPRIDEALTKYALDAKMGNVI